MFIKGEDLKVQSRSKLRDGSGTVDVLRIVPEDFSLSNCRLFSVMTLEKGCSIGKHDHTGETEVYYVLEGEGILDDNGTRRVIKPGDVNICSNGEYHAVQNENDEALKMIAVIIKD